jgi:hypothetical protein
MFGIQNPLLCLFLLFLFSFLSLWIIVICCLQSPIFTHSLEIYMAISLDAVISLYMQVYTDFTFVTFLSIILFKVACTVQVLRSSSVLFADFQLLYCVYHLLNVLQYYILHMVYLYNCRLLNIILPNACKFLFVQNYLEVNGKEFECCRFILRFLYNL